MTRSWQGFMTWFLLSFSLLPFGVPAATPPLVEKQPPPRAPAGRLTPLNIVYNNISIGATPIWITHQAGFFRKHGLDVNLSFARGTLAEQAMLAGTFPVGFVSSSAVINSSLAGARIKIVASVSNKMLYAVVAARAITSAAQLRGKRVGISRFGDASETATRLAARELGLDPDRELAMLQIGNSPDRFAALQAGTIDAMVADPADVVRARREGLNVLIDLTAKGIDYQGGGLSMMEGFIRDQRETALNFVRAFAEGIHYYKNNREEVVRVAASYLKTSDLDMLRQAWQVFAERLIPMKPYPSVKGIQLVIGEVASRNPAARSATPEQFIDATLMEEIDRSGFIDRLYR